MTTLAAGSSVSLTLANNGFLEVATNGGFGSVTITPTGGSAVTESWGPSPFRKKYAGPYPEGATVTLTNASSASFDYETDTSNLPISLQAVGASAVAWGSRPSASASSGLMLPIDVGMGLAPVLMRSDGTYWRLMGTTVVLDNNTTVAGTGSTSEQIIKQVTIPAGLLMSWRGFRVSHLATKAGTNGAVTTVQYRLGTTGTTSDASIYTTASWSGATMLQHSGGRLLRSTSTTNLRAVNAAMNFSIDSTATSTSAFPTDTTISDSDANALILSLTVTCASALDTPSGQRLTIEAW